MCDVEEDVDEVGDMSQGVVLHVDLRGGRACGSHSSSDRGTVPPDAVQVTELSRQPPPQSAEHSVRLVSFHCEAKTASGRSLRRNKYLEV